MIDMILTANLHVSVLVIGAIIFCLFARKNFNVKWFLGAVALYFIYDFFLTRFYGMVPSFIGENWNWTGKLMSTAAMGVVAAFAIFGWRKVGLTFKQKEKSAPAWIFLGILSVLIFFIAIKTGDGPDDLETIAFQWTMPGIDEELFYRGVLLLALNETFKGTRNILGAAIGFGGILTCILFGVIHALAWKDGGVTWKLATFAMTGIPSFILLWLREKTGSLIAPILAHNVANGASCLF